MILYHRTDHAEAILRAGFRDGTGSYLTLNTYTGVWLSDLPLDANEGAVGDQVLEVTLEEDLVAEFEWIEEGKGYREFLVPADLLNDRAKVRLLQTTRSTTRSGDRARASSRSTSTTRRDRSEDWLGTGGHCRTTFPQLSGGSRGRRASWAGTGATARGRAGSGFRGRGPGPG